MMSKKPFTKKEIVQLSKNPYVKSVRSKGITYLMSLKNILYLNSIRGSFQDRSLKKHGFDVEVIGIQRIKSASESWRAAYKVGGVMGLERHQKRSILEDHEKKN